MAATLALRRKNARARHALWMKELLQPNETQLGIEIGWVREA